MPALISYGLKKIVLFSFPVILMLTFFHSGSLAQSSYSWQGALHENLNAENFWVYPCADLGADGKTYLMYRYKNGDDIRIKTWNGSTWTSLTSIQRTSLPNCKAISDYQDIAVDGNNHLHVVIKATNNNDTHGLYYGYYNGTSWSFEYFDSYPALFNSQYYVDRNIIDVDASNNPYIAYSVNYSGTSPAQNSLKCAMKKNGSWTISTIETIVENKGDELDMYDFAVSPSGVPHAVYTDEYNNDYIFDIRHEYFNGTSWVPTTISSNTSSGGFLIAVDTNNDPYIAASITSNDFTSYAFKLFNKSGGSWTSETISSSTATDYWVNNIAFNGNNDLNILYSEFDWNTWEASSIKALRKESGAWKSFTSTVPSDWALFSEGAYTFDNNKKIVIAYSNDLSERPRTISYRVGTYSPGVTVPTAPSTPDLAAASDAGSSNTDNKTNDDTPAFTGTSQPSKTIKLYANGTEVGSTTADGSGNWSITSSSLTSATYSITAKASDGNGESAGSTALSVTIDTQAPTASLSSTATSPTNATSFSVSITFNESVTGFDINDIIVSGGTTSGFSGSGSSYSVNVTPSSDGTVTVNIASSAANDIAGNGNTAAMQLSRVSDRTSPTVVLATATADPTNAASMAVTITFSESVTGFVVGDIAVSGGTKSNFSGSGASYSVDVTPTGDGTVTVDVAASVASDASGNTNQAATQLSRTFDRSVPTVSISSTASGTTNSNPISISITFSESVTGFTASDVTLNGATKGVFSGSGTAYMLELIPSAEGTITADIGSSIAQDNAGNSNSAATQFSRTYDSTAPTISITSTASSTTNASSISLVFTSTENISDFTASDVVVTNGSLQNFSGSGTGFTATVIPASDGVVSVNISAGAFTDAAGNTNTAAAQLQRTYDGTKPSAAISSPAGNIGNVSPIDVTITFSESVTGVDISDVAVTGGSKSDFSGSASSYSFKVTPSGDGIISINVDANAATDAAGNGNTAATGFQHTHDTAAPAVSMSSASSPTNSSPVAITFTFSESVSGFTKDDITVSGGSKGDFSGSGSSYTLAVTPSAQGTITADVAASVAVDQAGNGNTAATQFSTVFDNIRPSVSITSTESNPTNATQFAISIMFSEPVTNFTANDITVTGGTKSDFSGSGSSYSIAIAPTSDGTITVNVASSVATDAAGNDNTAASQFSIVSDRSSPTVTLSSTTTSPTNQDVFTVAIAFSKPVTGFEINDITVSGGSKSTFSGSGASYSVEIAPSENSGAVTVDVSAGAATDGTGNSNVAASQFTMAIDKTKPTVNITSNVSGTINTSSFPVTITFSEDATGFDSDDITVTNGSKSSVSGNGSSYSITISPSNDGPVVISIPSGMAQDVAGNSNESSNQFSVISDRTKPTATLSTPVSDPVNTPFLVFFTFNESVTGFTQSDITVGNATVSDFEAISGSAYKALITPVTDGNVTVDVLAGMASDIASNSNTASVQLIRRYDGTKPSVAISSTSANSVNTSFSATFTFSESVTGFDINDIVVANGSASSFSIVSGSVYTSVITPANAGNVDVSVNAAVAHDAAGNSNTSFNTLTRVYDPTQPALEITTTATSPTNTAFTVLFTFSEDVTGFNSGDVTIVNGAGSELTASSASAYAMLITPVNDGDVEISVAAGLAADVASNGNLASNTLTRNYDGTAPTVTASAANTLFNSDFTITFTFSEPVTGFDLNDITVTNGSAGHLTTSDHEVFSADITSSSDGNVTVFIASGKASDAAGNGNTAGNVLSVEFDGTAPAGYSISSDISVVELNNVSAFSFDVAGAEINTAYYYTIASSNGGVTVSGSGEVTHSAFTLSDLDLRNVPDGTLTITFYLVDDAGNHGVDATLLVPKVTRNVISVTNPANITAAIRTAFSALNLPATVEVTYSSTEKEFVAVTWSIGNYEGTVAAVYSITGNLILPQNASNSNNLKAVVTIEVKPNQSPTDITLSSTSFQPDISPVDPIGSFSTQDVDDTNHFYELVSGEGDAHNSYFAVGGDQLFLNPGNNLSGITAFQIRVRSTDPYNNSIERTLTLAKSGYTPPNVQIKIPNGFSPNGDGINDVWIIPELQYYNDIVVEVFDRAGNRLFHTTNPALGWSGIGLDNKILLGPYFYVIRIKDTNETKQGVLMILKK